MATKKTDERAQAFEAAGEHAHDHDASNGDAGFSPAGLLCNNILPTLNETPELSEKARLRLGAQFGHLLELFHDQEERAETTKRQLSRAKMNLRLAKEQLKTLRQELFDKSSERGAPARDDVFDQELDLEDDDVDEPREPPRGKRACKLPKDAELRVINHYPADHTYSCCGGETQSIRSWDSTQMKIIPEHVVFIKHVHHTCACNRGARCKENKPVSAKSRNFIMKGRAVDPQFAAEAAVQKFFEHTPTFRMERRLQYANVNFSKQAIGSAIAHLAGHLEPVRLALLDHIKAGHVVHADETPCGFRPPVADVATRAISGRCVVMSAAGIPKPNPPWFTSMRHRVLVLSPGISLTAQPRIS